MIDPNLAYIFVGLALALVLAATIPAPTRPVDDQAAVFQGLIAIACAIALIMGGLALAGLAVASTLVGAVAWMVVMPCVWLSRAPRPPEEQWGDEQEEDDDGGGSPSPFAPSAPPAPSDRRPDFGVPVTAAVPLTWTPAPQPAPVLATATRAQRLIAAQEAQRLLAAQEVQRLLAAQRFDAARAAMEAERLLALTAAAAPQPSDALPDAPSTPAPLHTPEWPQLRPAVRARADHRTITHALAAVGHACTRRRIRTPQRTSGAGSRG